MLHTITDSMQNSILSNTTAKYIKKFNILNPNKNILDKSYNITIIRSLIMYFLYLEKKQKNNKDFKTVEIASALGVKNHTTVVRAINKIELYLSNEKYIKCNNSTFQKNFRLHFFIFQKLFNSNK